MRIISYSKTTMITNAIGCIVLALLGGWAFLSVEHFQLKWFGGCLAVSLPVAAFFLFRRALGDCHAIAYNGKGMKVTTLFREAIFFWPQLHDISCETLQQQSLFGLIKQNVGYYLVFTFYEDGDLRKFRINEGLLNIPKGTTLALIEDITRASQGPQSQVQAQRAGQAQSQSPSSRTRYAGTPAFGRKPF